MAHMDYPYWFYGSRQTSRNNLAPQPIATPQLTGDNSALLENYQANPADFNALRSTINRIGGVSTGQQNMPPPSGAASQAQNGRPPYYNSYGPYHAGGSGIHPQNHGYGNGDAVGNGGTYPGAPRTPQSDKLFKNTPFYTIETRIGPLNTCPGKSAPGPLGTLLGALSLIGLTLFQVMNNHRNSITVTLKASDYPELSRCATNLPDKVMLFCGSQNTGPQEIEFPHQSEIKVNGEDIKHNLRGLKNKPGSTHPVDITPFLRIKPSYINNIEFTYALTSKVNTRRPAKQTRVSQIPGVPRDCSVSFEFPADTSETEILPSFVRLQGTLDR